MVTTPYTRPAFKLNAFNCIGCGAYAHHEWVFVHRSAPPVYYLYVARCMRCGHPSLWNTEESNSNLATVGRLVIPRSTGAPPPNPDLTDDIVRDYSEAANIVNDSPRGAAALLRLAVQRLCVQLGLPGEKLFADIGALVERGVPVWVQQAMDTVRVIGNNAVHPGQIDMRDDAETAAALFELINIIANQLISHPQAIEDRYGTLPATIRDAIAARDEPGD